VLCGGDHVEAFGGKDSIDRTIVDYKEKWVRTIERAGGEFLPAKGNHDFTIRKSMQVKEGFTYSNREARDILMDTDAVRKRAVVNPDDPEKGLEAFRKALKDMTGDLIVEISQFSCMLYDLIYVKGQKPEILIEQHPESAGLIRIMSEVFADMKKVNGQENDQ
jgi:hypothetical protein